jgi:hypothetical protein
VQKLQLYTQKELDQLRFRQDELADLAVMDLVSNPTWITEINSWKIIPKQLPIEFSDSVTSFFNFYQQKVGLADNKILRGAQDYFDQNGDLHLAMLGFYALPYCYAFADGAEVLVRSNRIVDQIGERLGETGGFVMELFRPGAFSENDRAFLVCGKVRLIHAFSRYFILKYAKDWNPDFGKPVNQEDMLGTNLAFSFIVLRGLTKMGFAPTEDEQKTVLAYWKWIGELMGIDVSFWPETPKEAFELDRIIRKRHLKSSAAGQKLINSLIRFYQETIPDAVLSDRIQPILSFFLGKEASLALGISYKPFVSGDIIGWMFSLLGWKNYGGKKGYQRIRKMMESQQKDRFGKVLEIRLPELNRP